MPPPVLDALILQPLSHGGALLLVAQHWTKYAHIWECSARLQEGLETQHGSSPPIGQSSKAKADSLVRAHACF